MDREPTAQSTQEPRAQFLTVKQSKRIAAEFPARWSGDALRRELGIKRIVVVDINVSATGGHFLRRVDSRSRLSGCCATRRSCDPFSQPHEDAAVTPPAWTPALRPFCLGATIGLLVIGCQQQDSGPTYAELVVIYKTELESLDRLEKKKESLISKYEAELNPKIEPIDAIGDMLKSARELGGEIDREDLADPSRLLDKVAENSEAAQDLVGDAMARLTKDESLESPEEKQRKAKLTEQFEKELAALDKEIEAQQARVERAAKHATPPKRTSSGVRGTGNGVRGGGQEEHVGQVGKLATCPFAEKRAGYKPALRSSHNRTATVGRLRRFTRPRARRASF